MTFANAEQAEYWESRAPSWISMESLHDRIIGPSGRMAMDRLDPQPGHVLVDLGCGTGQTTVELARRVTPGGRVTGLDISGPLLARARENAAAAGLGNIEFQHADVQSSDIGRGRFDGAFSRFGVMFFADPVAAFTNVHDALKPGGVLSFACWQPVTSNDWMLAPTMAAISVLGELPEVPPADAPGPFSLSDPDRARSLLEPAGFRDIAIDGHSDMLTLREDAIAPWVESAMNVGAVQRMLQDKDTETADKVRAAINAEMKSRVKDGEVALSRSVFLVRAAA